MLARGAVAVGAGSEVELVGYGVIAVPAPRMTTKDAPHGQIESLDGAVLLDGLNGVVGTGRRESA